MRIAGLGDWCYNHTCPAIFLDEENENTNKQNGKTIRQTKKTKSVQRVHK